VNVVATPLVKGYVNELAITSSEKGTETFHSTKLDKKIKQSFRNEVMISDFLSP